MNKKLSSRILIILASLILSISATSVATAIPNPSGGSTSGGTTVTFEGIKFIKVSSTMTHTLALTSEGTVYAWGTNAYGCLGDGTNTNRSSPVQVKGVNGTGYLTGVTDISAGAWFSVAVTSSGVVAWGLNGNGQLGNATNSDSYFPTYVKDVTGTGNLTGVSKVSAGGAFALALKNSTVVSWGLNHLGQLGNNSWTASNIPVQVVGVGGSGILSEVSDIAAGKTHSLAITSNGVVSWGFNVRGQLGNNTTTNNSAPVQVLGVGGTGSLTGMTSIAAGENFSLASSNQAVYGWGENGSGQLGDTSTTSRLTPVQVVGVAGTGYLTGVTAIGTGLYNSLAVTPNGVVAWGLNPYGELGNNSTVASSSPVEVLGVGGSGRLTNVTGVDGGEYFSTAVGPSGVLAWGRNDGGFLGTGNTTNSQTPVISANFQPATVTFAGVVGTSLSSSSNTWSVTSPSGNAGTAAIVATANVFGGSVAATPATASWTLGDYAYVNASTAISPVGPGSNASIPASGLSSGQSALIVNGTASAVTVAPNVPSGATAVNVSGTGFSMSLQGLDQSNEPLGLASDGALVIKSGRAISISGSGYMPYTNVDIYIFSSPRLLGSIRTDGSGNFNGLISIPGDLEVGRHTLQMNGYTTAGEVRSFSLGVKLEAVALAATGNNSLFQNGFVAIATLIFGFALLVHNRKRS